MRRIFFIFVTLGMMSLLSCSHIVDSEKPVATQIAGTDFVEISAGTMELGYVRNGSSGLFPSLYYDPYDVTLTRAFQICNHEVTQSEWQTIMSNNPSYFQGDDEGKKVTLDETQGLRPVERVSWYDAIVYCNKLSIKEGLEPCYTVEGVNFSTLKYEDVPTSYDNKWNLVTCDFRKNGYRLPTAAEWEIAARGGLTGDVYPGTASVNKLDAYAWYGRNSENRTHEVKKKQPNGYGLYDMGGNVLEWCWDWGGAGEYRKTATDPTGPYIPYSFDRMVHGSYWGDEDHLCKVYRILSDPSYYRHWTVGFRVVRSVVVD